MSSRQLAVLFRLSTILDPAFWHRLGTLVGQSVGVGDLAVGKNWEEELETVELFGNFRRNRR